MMVIQEKDHSLAAADQSPLQTVFLVEGTFQVRGDGLGAVFRMARDANRISAQEFDLVVAVTCLDCFNQS